MQEQTGKIRFIDYHRPDLDDGDYSIVVTQTIKTKKIEKDKTDWIKLDEFSSAPFKFSVLGPRFTLDPQLIESVFPPPGSLGNDAHVLPHLLLKRSTLPWERTISSDQDVTDSLKATPWLALLLFDEQELSISENATFRAKTSTINLGSLSSPDQEKIFFPHIKLEIGDHIEDKVTVIDVPRLLLEKILPSAVDLNFLAHVRQTEDATGKLGADEYSVIIGNRLPKPGGNSFVHLVSLEGRYRKIGSDFAFEYKNAKPDEFIRLVSLKSWRFACTEENGESFSELAKNLNTAQLRLPPLAKEFKAAEEYLKKGCVPLPHAMREGNKSVSWYRSPLVPFNNNSNKFKLPIRTADQLTYYDDTYGVFDVSYSAAWELGRLLALQSKTFSISLYHWKLNRARKQKDTKNADELKLTHLPFDGPPPDLELPEVVSSWFEHLMLLEGIPFHYLVPDERMLPVERIRFFQVDPLWLECLLDGAFSIGRVSRSDHERDKSHQENKPSLPHRISGFLLRSDIVAGWPGLLVEGYDKVIDTGGFTPEKELLFEDLILPSEKVFDQDYINKIHNELVAKEINLSSPEKLLFEQRQWLITSSDQQFKLIKRENNEIDVCSAKDKEVQYLFSLDAGFETDLIGNLLSSEFLAIFQTQQIQLSHDAKVSVLSMFITDTVLQSHYLILKEETQNFKVYRSYKLPLLRMARLSANVLICLFEGVVKTVDLHLKPETLHFGIESKITTGSDDKKHVQYYQKLKSLPGRNLEGEENEIKIKWKNNDGNAEDFNQESRSQVINIKDLVEDIRKNLKQESLSSAEFAFEMISVTEKVRFYFSS